VAFPTVKDGYVPAYETIVIDTSEAVPTAYRVFVDARSGKVLARESLVDNATDQQAAAPTFTFNGELPEGDGGCDTTKGPYTVAAGDGIRAIDVFANADSLLNDIVLKLFQGTRWSPRPTPCARPNASTTRPSAACRRATTSSRCASSRTGRPRSPRAATPAP
jgi:hypothetical protein